MVERRGKSMRWSASLAGTALVGSALVWGCGKTEEAQVRDGPSAVPRYSGKVRPALEAYCEYLERCDPHALEAYAGGSLQACIDYKGCGANSNPTQVNADSSRADIQACAVAWQDFSCLQGLERRVPEECLLPYHDDRSDDAGPPRGGVDSDCFGNDCDVDLYCRGTEPLDLARGLACGTCQPKLQTGEACSYWSQCEGAFCIEGACGPRRANGEPCTTGSDCSSGRCDTGSCAESNPRPSYEEVIGQNCDPFVCQRFPSLTCLDGRCATRPDEGQRCEGLCRLGQECSDGICVSVGCVIDVGEPCTNSCVGACSTETRRCVPYLEAGDDCEGSMLYFSDCRRDLLCLDGKCRGPRDDGEPCGDWPECKSQYCEFEVACTEISPQGYRCGKDCEGTCGVCAPRPTVDECGGQN